MAAKKPVAKKPAPAAKPVAKTTAKPTKSVAKKPAPAKPAPAKPVAKTTAKPTKPVAKTAAKPTKPVAKTAAKPTKTTNDTYVKRSPVQAAKDLQNYVKQPKADLGKKGKPSVFIKFAQQDMGKLTADGIFGPKTKARAQELLTGKPESKPADTTPIAQAALLSPPEPAAAVKPAESQPATSEDESGDGAPDESLGAESEPAPATQAGSGMDPIAAAGLVAPTVVSSAPMTLPASVQAATAALSPDVKSIIIEALREFQNQNQATKADYDSLITKLTEKFAPNLKAISEQVEMQALIRQATSEHNALVKSDERWTKNNQNQQAIFDKMAELIKTIQANDAVSRRVYAVYGVHL
jgi:hypothetical protein